MAAKNPTNSEAEAVFHTQPIGARTFYDLPAGTQVYLHLHDGTIQYGVVFKNPKYGSGTNIQLLDSKRVRAGQSDKTPGLSGVLEFTAKEIYRVQILKAGKPAEKAKRELIFKTFVVQNQDQLDYLRRTLQRGTSEIGVKLFTENYGRFAKAYWLLLCSRDTIIAVNIEALVVAECDVWNVLKSHLFENERIVKIIHNSRLESDFLFHCHGIKMVNVFDTQLCAFYFSKRNQLDFEEAAKSNRGPGKFTEKSETDVDTLSATLRVYLTDAFLSRERMVMECFENINICVDSPYSVQPKPAGKTQKYMALTVKYLIPLRQAMLNEFMRGYNNCLTLMTDMMTAYDAGKASKALLDEDKCFPGISEVVKEMAGMYSTEMAERLKKSHEEFVEAQLD